MGAEPVFTGEIRARFSDEAARRHCERWLGKALARVPAIGAQKGVGYGRVVRAELLRLEPVARVEPRIDSDALGTRIGLVLHLSQPFNIAQTAQFQPENNRYLNHDQIPGAAIKGVLARAHGGAWEALQRDLALDDLVVTTALPAPRTNPRRSLPLPLSLAVFATPRGLVVHDLALEAVPGLLEHDSALVPPCFLPDWKDAHREHARRAWDPAAAGAAPPEHLLVIRTAIRPEDQVAEESQLFALECTDVRDHCWCLDLDLRQVHPADPAARRAVTERLVALLSAGLEDLGKTRACARVEIRPQPFGSTECPQPIPIDGLDGWVILLRTPARLLPARIEALAMPIPPTNVPNGRKHYLVHDPHAVKAKRPSETRKLDTIDRTHPTKEDRQLLEDYARQGGRYGNPLADGQDFWFHVDFDHLTEAELGLLCSAIDPGLGAPNPDPLAEFHHRLGWGRPVGLGVVRIVVEGLFLIARPQRYSARGFDKPRYQFRWLAPGDQPIPDALGRRYPDELAQGPLARSAKALPVAGALIDQDALAHL